MNVTFCGHREMIMTEKIDVILNLYLGIWIALGADTFYMGNCGNFDIAVARKIRERKKEDPYLRSVLVLPCNERPYMPNLYDEIEIAPESNTCRRFNISKCNEYMVMKADTVIAYVKHSGGAKNTMKFAKRKGKDVINIAEKSIY